MMTPSDRILEENLGALLRAADDPLTPADVDRACASFLSRAGRESKRPRPWLALASAAAVVLSVVIWGSGGSSRPGGQAGQIDRWIGDLGHEDPGVRDRAARALGDLGLDLSCALASLEKGPVLPDDDARARAGSVARALRSDLGLEISHEDGPPIRPAPSASTLHLEVYDVSDLFEVNTLTGEDLAQLTRANVRPDRWREEEGAGMTYTEGILAIRNLPEVHDAIRAFYADLRAGRSRPPPRRRIEDRILELGSAGRAERDAAEARLRDLGTGFAYALGALYRLKASADPDLRLRALEIRRQLVEAMAPLFTHHVLRRAAIGRVRMEWSRTRREDRPELVRKAFEPCRASDVQVHPDLLTSGLRPEALEALERGDGIVSLWLGHPFSFRSLGARETTLAFSIPGEPCACVTVRFER
jgi:hypothetical protein